MPYPNYLALQPKTAHLSASALNPLWQQSAPQSDDLSLSALLNSAEPSQHLIIQTMHRLPTRYRLIAASLTHKALTSQLIGHWLTAALLRTPFSANSERLTFSATSPYPLTCPHNPNPQNTAQVIDYINHTSAQLVHHFRKYHRLPNAIAWGNSALAIARPWLILNPYYPATDIFNNAQEFITQLRPELSQALDYTTANNTFHIKRHSCCLKHRLVDKPHCTTCPHL